MGICESQTQTPNYDTKYQWQDVFHNGILKYLSSKPKPDSSATSDFSPIPLSYLFERLLGKQINESGDINDDENFDASFFKTIHDDVNFNLNQSSNFTRYFSLIRGMISKLHDTEKQVFADQLFEKAKNFQSVQTAEEQTAQFHQIFLSTFFESILPSISDLDPEDIQETLDQLIQIISSAPAHSLRGVNSQIIKDVHLFAKQLFDIPKFNTPDIQYRAIHVFYSLAILQCNISGCLSALLYMINLPPDFTVTSTFSSFSSYSIENPGSTLFTLPLKNTGQIIDFILSTNRSFFLTEQRGLIAITDDHSPDEPLRIDYQAGPKDRLALYGDRIYIFKHDISEYNYQVDSYSLTLDDKKTEPLAKFTCEVGPIYGVGSDSARLFIAQKSNDNFVITQYQGCTNTFITSSIPLEEKKDNPIVSILFHWGQVLFCFKNGMTIQHIVHASGEISHQTLSYLPQSPITFPFTIKYNNFIYITLQSDGLLMNKKALSGIIDLFSSQPIVEFESGSLNDILYQFTLKLNTSIEPFIQGIASRSFNKITPGYTFFTDSGEDGIRIASSIISKALSSQSLATEVQSLLVSFSMKLISLNLFDLHLRFFQNKDNSHKLKESELALIIEARKALSQGLRSRFSQSDPNFINSFIAAISLDFRYLFYKDYSQFSSLINYIINSPSLSKYFLAKLSFLDKTPAILYIFTPVTTKTFMTLPAERLNQIFSTGLDLLVSEMDFIEKEKLLDNDQYIAPFITACLSFIKPRIESESGLKLLQKFCYRISTWENYPILAINAIEASLPIIKILADLCSKEKNIINNDSLLSQVVKQKDVTFSPNTALFFFNFFLSSFGRLFAIGMRSIPVTNQESDNKIVLESDILDGAPPVAVYHENDRQVTKTSSGSGLRRPFAFQGLKNESSGDIVNANDNTNQNANANQNSANSLCGLGNRLTRDSNTINDKTNENNQGSEEQKPSLVRNAKLIRLNSSTNQPMRTLSRGLSRGLSFDASKSDHFTDELKKGFLNDIIKDKPLEKGPADVLLTTMYKKVPPRNRLRACPEIFLKLEKYMVAALMKQLGFVGTAYSYAINPTGNEPPPNLTNIWKTLSRFRDAMLSLRQKFLPGPNDPVPPGYRPATAIPEEFKAAADQIIMKCEFLLYSDPLLKKRFGSQEKFDAQQQIEKASDELFRFITNKLKMEALSEMIARRTTRLQYRMKAINSLSYIINLPYIPQTSLMCLFQSLDDYFSIMLNKTNLRSVQLSLMNKYDSTVFDLVSKLCDIIVDIHHSVELKMLILKLLSNPIDKCLTESQRESLILKLLNVPVATSIEGKILDSSIWKLLSAWTIVSPTLALAKSLIQILGLQTDLISAISSITTNNEDHEALEAKKRKALLLLAVLVQREELVPITVQDALSLISQSSSKTITSIFILVSQILINRKISPNFIVYFNGEKFTLSELLLKMVYGNWVS